MNPTFKQTVLSRDEVEKLVNGERVHQNILLGARTPDKPHSLMGNVLLIDTYINRAVYEWAEHPHASECLSNIRKVAAIGLRCLENYGGLDGNGHSREEAYNILRTTRSVPLVHVEDLAEALVRLRSLSRSAEDAGRETGASDGHIAGIVFNIVAHCMTIMEVHGAPPRTGL